MIKGVTAKSSSPSTIIFTLPFSSSDSLIVFQNSFVIVPGGFRTLNNFPVKLSIILLVFLSTFFLLFLKSTTIISGLIPAFIVLALIASPTQTTFLPSNLSLISSGVVVYNSP
jgi:hypothetical protein